MSVAARASLVAGFALAVAGCAAPPPPPKVDPGPFHAELAPGIIARTEPVEGAPPAQGAILAKALARRLGPPATAEDAAAARRELRIAGRVAGDGAALEADPARDPAILRVDWSVRDERGARVGEFRSAAPFAPPGAALGWDRMDAAAVNGVAAGAAQKLRRLPPVRATLAGKPGF